MGIRPLLLFTNFKVFLLSDDHDEVQDEDEDEDDDGDDCNCRDLFLLRIKRRWRVDGKK